MDALLRCGTTDITVSTESPSKKRNTVGIFGKSEFFWVNGDVHCQEKMPYVSVILIFFDRLHIALHKSIIHLLGKYSLKKQLAKHPLHQYIRRNRF